MKQNKNDENDLKSKFEERLQYFEQLFEKIVLPKIEIKIKQQKKYFEKQSFEKEYEYKKVIKNPQLKTIKKAFDLNSDIIKKEEEKNKMIIFKKVFKEKLNDFAETLQKLKNFNYVVLDNLISNKRQSAKNLRKKIEKIEKYQIKYINQKIKSETIQENFLYFKKQIENKKQKKKV